MLPISAATKASGRKSSVCSTAAAVPTSTGAIAAGSVRGRAAISQILIAAPPPRSLADDIKCCRSRVQGRRSGSFGEVGPAALDVGVAALLALLGHVEEHVRVVRELLQAGEPVLVPR